MQKIYPVHAMHILEISWENFVISHVTVIPHVLLRQQFPDVGGLEFYFNSRSQEL